MRDELGAAVGGQAGFDKGAETCVDRLRAGLPTRRKEIFALACAGSTVLKPLPV